MTDEAKLETAKTLLLLLTSREAFIGTCRWRAKEWSRIVWVFYSRVERDNHLAAAILMSDHRQSRSLSTRQLVWLKGFDQWMVTLPS